MAKKKGLPKPPGGKGAPPRSAVSAPVLIAVGVTAVLVVALLIWFAWPGRAPGAVPLPRGAGQSAGPENAPVHVEEFSDFQCPYCRDAALGPVHRLLTELVPTGQVRFTFRHKILFGAESQRMAEAATCAGAQNRFWDYHDRLFREWRGENTGYFTAQRLQGFAQDLGLDQAAFQACLEEGQARAAVLADNEDSQKRGVRGTPTFFINGKMVQGLQSYDQLTRLISEAAGGAR